jgi:ribose 5-phosphate isomerase A
LITDNGNYYVRCWFDRGIADPYALSPRLNAWPGVVENGLFLEMATDILVAGAQGVRVMEKTRHD